MRRVGVWLGLLLLGFACHPNPEEAPPAGDAHSGGSGSESGDQHAVGGGADAPAGGGAGPSAGGESAMGGANATGGQTSVGGTSVGGSDVGAGGRYAALGGTFFSGGSRLEFSFQPLDVDIFLSPDISQLDVPPLNFDAGTTRLLEAEGLSHETKLSIRMPYLFDNERCSSVSYGAFEVEDFVVDEDLDETDAHLAIERGDGGLELSYEGLGRHLLTVHGTFTTDMASRCTELFDEEGRLAVTFRREITVEVASSARLRMDERCPDETYVLSGEALLGESLVLVDADDEDFYPDNVDPSFPISVLVETEREATISAASNVARVVTVSGESQLVRLSTRFGTLLVYELVAPSQIQDWDVQFWIASGHGTLHDPIETGETYPGGSLARYIGADVTLLKNGVSLCSMPDWNFSFTSLTPEVCTAGLTVNSAIATMVDGSGHCEFDMNFPAAREEQGLSVSFSATFTADE